MNGNAPPIFVISLACSAERRDRTRAQLASLRLPHEIIDARDAVTAGVPVVGTLTPGEVGCLLSHVEVLERIAEGAAPIACVLEDDCALTEDFARTLRAVAGAPAGWDVLLLGHHSRRRGPAAGAYTCMGGRRIEGHRIARVAEFPMGAYAYIVTRDGARTLARHARPLRMPFDWVTGYSPAAGARLCAVTPPCVVPLPSSVVPTTIHGRVGETIPRGRKTVRDHAGWLWLRARRFGLWPSAYVRRL